MAAAPGFDKHHITLGLHRRSMLPMVFTAHLCGFQLVTFKSDTSLEKLNVELSIKII